MPHVRIDPRPSNRERENENLRPSGKSGEPPRPATEPPGAKGSAENSKTLTDPATGEPSAHRNP